MAALAYLQQRFHPLLIIGCTALARTGKKVVPIHCRQGDMDGACGAHCAIMALTILGLISEPSRLADRRNGVASRLWAAAKQFYFDGVSTSSLANLLESIGADLRIGVESRSPQSIHLFTSEQLLLRTLVILSWRTINSSYHHWVLLVGIEGVQSGRTFEPTAYLCLDPSADCPLLSGYNGRLEFFDSKSGAGRYQSTSDLAAAQVVFTGAVSLR